VDRDLSVQKIADEIKSQYLSRFEFFHEKFSDIKSVCDSEKKIDGIVLDLGVSTFQLTDPARGFSFNLSGPVDMGMGLCDQTAMDVIQRYSKQDLANIIYEYGEEHFSRRIAENIKKNLKKIHTTEDLANIIRSCVRKTGKIDPATKTFQALRIFVNQELEELKKVLRDSIDLLKPGGKIIVVSFHSLEDRIVKLFFRELMQKNLETGEASERSFTLLTKKPVTPSAEEISANQKSRSAKLRGISMLC
jgi:16S rRNA (cytosine1402-N4)-methyltransferase